MELLIEPWVGGLIIPLLILALGGAIKWVLHGGKYPRRDYFLLGIELALTATTLSFTNIFEWIRRDFLKPENISSDHFEVLLFVLQLLGSLAALLVVLGAMRHYVDGMSKTPQPDPTIGWGRWIFINALGASPLGFTLYLLI